MIPALHVLVSEREIDRPASLEIARTLVELHPPVALHLRARIATRDLFEVARDLSARAWVSGGWCVVSGRPDVALAASAQAVQLGRTALTVSDAKRVLGADSGVRIGVSIHSDAEARAAAGDGADYVVAGTAFPTPSHPGEPGCGTEGIAAMRAAAGLPTLAIGGVDTSRVSELVEAGSSGVVAGRAVWDAPDPVAAAVELSSELLEAAGRAQ